MSSPVPFLLVPLLASLVPGPRAGESVHFEDLALRLAFPDLDDWQTVLAPQESGFVRGEWHGTLLGADVAFQLVAFDAAEWRLEEAGGVLAAVLGLIRGQGDLDVAGTSFHEGPYGTAPILALAHGPDARGEEPGYQYVAGGLTAKHGYALHVRTTPVLDANDAQVLLDFFEDGIRYEGPEREPEWSLEEIEARWKRDVPEQLHEDFLAKLHNRSKRKKVALRTDHYLILTNSSGGKLFAKKMEENYREIVKQFPFAVVEGRRLMPVFLFRTADDYYRYYMHVAGRDYASVRRTKGHAWRDYYATWYEAPGDPVHIHEQVHQIFANRLFLRGGGSWFQEGVAEYIESSENDRNAVANQVAKGNHLPLAQFFQLPSLVQAGTQSQSADFYKMAALLIEFLRESRWGKGRFEDFLGTLGHVPRGNLEKIEAGLRAVYGVGVDELDAAFQEYCRKR